MKNELIWSYVKETTSHLQNKLTKNMSPLSVKAYIIICSRYDIADTPGWVHNKHHIQFIITCSRYDIADAPDWVHNRHHIQFIIICSRFDRADTPDWVHNRHHIQLCTTNV
jgi:hypothetical protein